MDNTPSGPSPSGMFTVQSCWDIPIMVHITFLSFQIIKDEINNYQIGRRFPHCGFELELLSEQVQRLRHKVVIKGVPSPNSFHIRYPQPEGDKAGNYQP